MTHSNNQEERTALMAAIYVQLPPCPMNSTHDKVKDMCFGCKMAAYKLADFMLADRTALLDAALKAGPEDIREVKDLLGIPEYCEGYARANAQWRTALEGLKKEGL